MAFIDKKDPVVLNIKLTTMGRELLSQGELTFKYFAVGDSEIDYEFNRNSEFDPFYTSILRPADVNPKQLSFVTRDLDGDSFNSVENVPSTPSIVENTIQPVGFFNNNADMFLNDTDHVKQPDAMIEISGVSGGVELNIKKAPTYQANPNEPAVGDFLMVKWSNPNAFSTTGYTLNQEHPLPYIWYRVENIVSGSLASDNLVIEVDRELPDFSTVTGSTINEVNAGAMFFNNYINYTGDTCYSTDETDDALIAFLQNCQCPTVTFPFWNMSIIFTENIVGVRPGEDKEYGDYTTKALGGFVSYIQNQAPVYKKLGVIHYTNNSVSNTYAESFYGDPLKEEDIDKIPTLDIPTVMWHMSSGNTMGVKLKASGTLKYLTGVTKSLNTRYYDLADESGNVVGKVFYDLKIFVVEDQELLFAMSYKSNRSWTLPNYGVDINARVTFGCTECTLDFTPSGVSPSYVGGNDGKIMITNIMNLQGDPLQGQLILEILEGPISQTGKTQVFFNKISGETTISNADTIDNYKIEAGIYTVKLTDLESQDCTVTYEYDLQNMVSTLAVFDDDTTTSKLTPYFGTGAYFNNPVRIRLFDRVGTFGVGEPYGTAYVTIGPTGLTMTNLTNRFNNGEGNSANEAVSNDPDSGKWVAIPSGSYLEFSNLTFLDKYAIYVRDAVNSDFNELESFDVKQSQVWSYYVAKAGSIEGALFGRGDFTLTTGTDGDGNYIVVSDYLSSSIQANVNPIIGDIEATVYVDNDGITDKWVGSDNNGSPIKLYVPDGGSIFTNYRVVVRERYDYINMYSAISEDTVRF